MIVTIGLFLALNSIVQVQFGSDIKTNLPRFYTEHDMAAVQRADLVRHARAPRVLAIACVLLYLLFQHTKVGLAMRAVASNSESTRAFGGTRSVAC